MLSTYLAFRNLTQDLSKSLARTAAKPDVQRDKEYYEANIGKVQKLDDFLNDRRLFGYAMKSFGLEDMAYAKAFMKKVLQSDLTKADSFARKLIDTRYIAFARAFNFSTDGTVKSATPFVQSDAQIDDTVGLYSEHRVRQGAASAAEVQYYQSQLATMTSVDQLVNNEKLFSFALTAFGLDPRIASESTIRNVLTSDLGDPDSVANTLGDIRYVALAAAFNFEADGSVAAGNAQSAVAVNETTYLYYQATGADSSPAAAAFEANYYRDQMAGITSVDDFLSNDRLLTTALTAFGFVASEQSKIVVRQVLVSDLNDPDSFANTLTDTRFRTMAAAFGFQADGSAGPGGAQTVEMIDATLEQYMETYDDVATGSDEISTDLFRSRINLMTSVDALMDNNSLYTYVLKAFGLDPKTESKAFIRQVLTSDASNPRSFANLQLDDRYGELAAAFNFAADGSVMPPRRAQVEKSELATINLYNTRIDNTDAAKKAATEENTYYHDAIVRVRSLGDLLADKRLMTYLQKAYDLEGERLSVTDLRSIFTSDPLDKNSFVNKRGDQRMRDMAAAFNFNSDGTVARVPDRALQTRSELMQTIDGFVRQTLETDAGAQNEGVRLALYFQRKAANLVSPFSILADKALIEVVRTALNFPAQMSQADIDVQAANISKRLNVADLKDPAKLDKFLTRFAAMYDMNNGGGFNTLSGTLAILGGNQGIGTNVNLLGSMQRILLGRG
jgi:hypothetical protein